MVLLGNFVYSDLDRWIVLAYSSSLRVVERCCMVAEHYCMVAEHCCTVAEHCCMLEDSAVHSVCYRTVLEHCLYLLPCYCLQNIRRVELFWVYSGWGCCCAGEIQTYFQF